MTKEEAQKWGLILLAYGFGDRCRLVVEKDGLNTVPLSDVYVVDSGDHGLSENDYKIMEYKNPVLPICAVDKCHWKYEIDASDKEYLVEKIKVPREEMFEFAKNVIKAALVSDDKETDYWTLAQVHTKHL